jgi:hypothetical protein
VAADVGQEELQAVAGAKLHGRRSRNGGLFGLLLARRADVEADCLELLRYVGNVLIAKVQLERKRLELGRLDVATLLGGLDEGATLKCL